MGSTAMPKTAVYKYGHPFTLKCKIRLPLYCQMSPPTFDMIGTKDSDKNSLRAFVAF